jgi:hypothetical protein
LEDIVATMGTEVITLLEQLPWIPLLPFIPLLCYSLGFPADVIARDMA